ncbi:hypothetical protein GQ54DRAFT_2799 [Martensiomyces pterosporus]|nr:hypothetical protein GQ54DRAFT_2799 [Martensiomyces pterosporus]
MKPVKDIDVNELKAECLTVVREGDLDKLTNRVVRRTLEKRMRLEEGRLDEQPYKQIVKDAVVAALEEIEQQTKARGSGFKNSPEVRQAAAGEQESPADHRSDMSDSELSDVIDDGPLPEKKSQKRAATPQSPQTPKRPKANAPLSKGNEATIANLKSYISKCGVRKVWSKELAGMNAAQQIRHLKKALAELGVEGRPTLEKCKRVKAKRDLLAEMEEMSTANIIDEEKDLAPVESVRSRRAAARRKISYSVDEVSESEEEAEEGAEAESGNESDAAGPAENQAGDGSAQDEEEGEESEESEESDAYTDGESESDAKAQDEDEDDDNDEDAQEEDESPNEESEAESD